MDASLLHQSHGGGLSWLNLAHNWVQNIPLQLWNLWGKEPLQTGLNFHLIYIYKVFKHLPMQWMVIWMHPYFITAIEVDWAGWIWITAWYKHTTTTMTWLRPRITSDWIKIPSYIYIKCLSTFQCRGRSYGCILTPSKSLRCTELAKSGSQLGTKHTTTTMTWLWPRTTLDWTTLPSYVHV